MKQLKILLIATYLPPYNGSGNIRLLNYINYLNRLGNEIDVVGVQYPKDSIAYDESLEDVFDNQIKVYRVKAGVLYNKFNRKRSVNGTEIKVENNNKKIDKLNRIKYKVNYFIKTTFLIPDSFVFWIRPAYNLCSKLIRENNYDLMLTVHETPSSHVVGYKLKKKYRSLKWVGYWSDPWNGDSVIREDSNKLKIAIEEKLEKNIVSFCDKLLFTTKATKLLYKHKYNLSDKKIDLAYRGFDINLYNKILEKNIIPKFINPDKINIIHTGTIYSNLRDINPLYNALKDIERVNKELFNKLNIIFIGYFTNREDEKLLKSLECVKLINSLPFDDAIEYVVYADILLLYGNKNSTQVPGKLYEYIGSKAMILTVLGDEHDELKEIMQEIDKGPILLNKKNLLFNFLINCKYLMSDPINGRWTNVCEKFAWENVALDLYNKLNF